MSEGPLDCNGTPLGVGDVCRVVEHPDSIPEFIGTYVTVTGLLPPGTPGFGPTEDGPPGIIFNRVWAVHAESNSLPQNPIGGTTWGFVGEMLQKLFGPSVDLDEDTEKEKDDALTV